MKISIFTDEVHPDFARTLEVLRTHDVHLAELRNINGKNLLDLTESELDDVERLLRKHGIGVSALGTPIFKCPLEGRQRRVQGDTFGAPERTYEEHLELLPKCFRLAERFGTRIVRCFSFWRDDDPEKVFNKVVERFGPALKIAEQHGFDLCMENEPSCYAGTGLEARRLIDAVGSPRLRVIWDPGNCLWADADPYPRHYEAVRGLVAHVHVKDARRVNGKVQPCRAGTGAVDYRGQLRALAQDGYNGAYTLEMHYKVDGGPPEAAAIESFAALRELLSGAGVR
jgi:L-ribulose-5-phosphate 3-epimerase